MQADRPLIVETDGDIAWLRLNRPRQMNAITPAMVHALRDALVSLQRSRCRALLLTGSGTAFCAGADLAELPGATPGPADSPALHDFLSRMGEVCAMLEQFSAPTIAVVNGLACAGGLELVLCCDVVLASDEARIGDMHANFGLLPGAGASVRLPQRIGMGAAQLLMYTGELWSAQEMHRLGLVQRLHSPEELEAQARKLAYVMAQKSPLAAARLKRLLQDGATLPKGEALRQEIDMLAEHARSADMGEGLSAFVAKRRPLFTGA